MRNRIGLWLTLIFACGIIVTGLVMRPDGGRVSVSEEELAAAADTQSSRKSSSSDRRKPGEGLRNILEMFLADRAAAETEAAPGRVDPEKPMVALTFDDGPNNTSSVRILDCLEANGAVATFFEVGTNVEFYPEITKRADALGCEIGSHTYDHIDLSSCGTAVMEADNARCLAAFRNAMGREPALMRPPGGAISSEAKDFYALPLYGWTLDTLDWKTRDAQATLDCIRAYTNLDGQIILMHSIYDSSADAACVLIPELLEKGYQLVTVSELMKYRYSTEPEPHVYYEWDWFDKH